MASLELKPTFHINTFDTSRLLLLTCSAAVSAHRQFIVPLGNLECWVFGEHCLISITHVDTQSHPGHRCQVVETVKTWDKEEIKKSILSDRPSCGVYFRDFCLKPCNFQLTIDICKLNTNPKFISYSHSMSRVVRVFRALLSHTGFSWGTSYGTEQLAIDDYWHQMGFDSRLLVCISFCADSSLFYSYWMDFWH